MTAWADHGPGGNGEPLAIMLRPGNAGSNTAAGHVEATRLALAQLPRHLRRKVLVGADPAGGTHEFLTWLTARSRRLHYSVGMTITDDMQAAIGKGCSSFEVRWNRQYSSKSPLAMTARRVRMASAPSRPHLAPPLSRRSAMIL